MTGGGVKTIVMLMVLVVLSAIIGSQFSGDFSESHGAFYVIGGIVVLFALLLMGEKTWLLVYLLPAILIGCPYGSERPIQFAISAALLVACLIMWAMGHVKLYWHSLWGGDLPVLVLLSLMVVSYIRFPVSVNALGLDYEYVGGKEYVWCVSALLHYIAISALTPHNADVPKVVKWSMLLMLLAQVPYCLMDIIGRRALVESAGVEERYNTLYYAGSSLLYFAYAKLPLRKLIVSVKTLLLLLFGLALILLTGGREGLLRSCAGAFFLGILKRELAVIVLLGGIAYGILFVLGEGKAFNDAPYSVQRTLTLIPGIEVSPDIKKRTEGSSETRRMIWAFGLDPRTGLIKDYVYGDGFQLSKSELERFSVAAMRGVAGDDQHFRKNGEAQAYALAAGNSWHNGWLTTVKRLGLVGLVALNIYFVSGLVLLAKVSSAYFGSKEYPYLMAMCLPFAAAALIFVVATQTFIQVFRLFLYLGYIKLLYCHARAQGRIRPLFVHSQYVPLIIREQKAADAR